MKNIPAMALAGALALATPAAPQQAQGGSSSQMMESAGNQPEACRTAAQDTTRAEMMQKMQDMRSSMSQQMQGGMQGTMGQMNETQKGLHEAMMNTHGPMMSAMTAKGADVAWICAMIPHHQAAIDMARAGLEGADNAESKKLAEEMIRGQEREIAKLADWVEKHALRESRNEATGSTK